MTGAGNHTYLLASRGAAILIDAGVGHPNHVAAIERALRETRSTLTAVAVTHHHHDHTSGAAAIAAAHPSAAFAKFPLREDNPDHAIAWHPLRDGDQIAFGQTSVDVVHTPGHSPDHVAFWHEATRALFTGDLVIAGGSVMIEASRGGKLVDYLRSLERVLALEPRRLHPAHGEQIDDPEAVVRAYIAHRLDRERQVVAALEAGHRTVEAIAESIYDDLDARLMPAAQENVRAHLEKLRVDGVADDREGWRRV
jgi:glyoxylase-like metal-dependent hydrolase (beta-lactamase superfamily II)